MNVIASTMISGERNEYALKFTPREKVIYEFNLIVGNVDAMGLNESGTNMHAAGIKISVDVLESENVIARYIEDARVKDSLSRFDEFSPKRVSGFFWGGMAAFAQRSDPIAGKEQGWIFPDKTPSGGLLRVGVQYEAIVRIEGDLREFIRVFGDTKLAIVKRLRR